MSVAGQFAEKLWDDFHFSLSARTALVLFFLCIGDRPFYIKGLGFGSLVEMMIGSLFSGIDRSPSLLLFDESPIYVVSVKIVRVISMNEGMYLPKELLLIVLSLASSMILKVFGSCCSIISTIQMLVTKMIINNNQL